MNRIPCFHANDQIAQNSQVGLLLQEAVVEMTLISAYNFVYASINHVL